MADGSVPGIRDLLDVTELNTAVVVFGGLLSDQTNPATPRVYGRIVGWEGTRLESVSGPTYPIAVVMTPHGSTLRAGRVWFRRIESDEEKAKLAEYEEQARHDLGAAYATEEQLKAIAIVAVYGEEAFA